MTLSGGAGGLNSCLAPGFHGSLVMAEESRGPERAPSSLSGSIRVLPADLHSASQEKGPGQRAKLA